MSLHSEFFISNNRLLGPRLVSKVKSQVNLNHSQLSDIPPGFPCYSSIHFLLTRVNAQLEFFRSERRKKYNIVNAVETKSLPNESQGYMSDSSDDDETCPVDCVKEFKTDDEFLKILEKAKKSNSLVVVDFYRTSCGSCKYIAQGFAKLCKSSGGHEDPVIFLKHNVIDEYDEQSEVAERLRIKTVPLFHFYKDGELLEAFPTRDKERIFAAINKYISPSV